MKLHWTAERARYIASRAKRYRDAVDLTTGWVDEAAADGTAIITDPDPKSRVGAIRVTGYSPSAGFVITLIARRIDGELWCDSAWKTTGAERRAYLEAAHDEAE